MSDASGPHEPKESTDRPEDVFRAWQDAQSRVWSAWADAASAWAPPGATSGGERGSGHRGETHDRASGGDRAWAGGEAWPDSGAAWADAARETAEAWLRGADPTAREAGRRVLDMQQMGMRYAGVIARAWSTLGRSAEGGGGWPGAIEAFNAQLRGAIESGPERWASSNADAADQWQAFLRSTTRMMGPWMEARGTTPGRMGSAMAGERSELFDILRMNWDAWEGTFGRLMESPSLGLTRELEEKLLRGFDAWLDYRRAVFEYQVSLSEVWLEAVDAGSERLLARAEASEPIESLRELWTVWIGAVDEKMEAAFRSEAYASVQGRMLNEAMRYRIHEREITDALLRSTDIPTRTELDQAYRDIYELRREVRALRREARARKHGGAAGADDSGGPKPASRHRSAAEPDSQEPSTGETA